MRLFEVMQKAEMINRERLRKNGYHAFSGASASAKALETDASLQLQYLVAPPQMAHYIQISTQIYQIYLRYVASEDIHVYSIDEVFIDISSYLKMYHCTPRALAERMIKAVLRETGITATVGIGSNLYLAKVAMDIVAKHMPADQDGYELRSWMRFRIGSSCGIISPLRISGESEMAIRRNCRISICIPWGTLRAVLCRMKTSCIVCLA